MYLEEREMKAAMAGKKESATTVIDDYVPLVLHDFCWLRLHAVHSLHAALRLTCYSSLACTALHLPYLRS